MANSLLTPYATLMFPHLFVPRPRATGGEPVFNCILLFEEKALKDPLYLAMRKGVAEAVDEKFGQGKSKDTAWMSRVKFRTPFRDAEEKSQYNGFLKGMAFINPWTKEKPGIIDGRKNEIVVPADLWAGQVVRARVRPFAYSNSGNTGASFMLDNIQLVFGNRPRMDGRMAAKDAFDEIEGAEGAEGALADADDSPF